MKRVAIFFLVLCLAGSCVSGSGQTGENCQLCGKNSLWEYYRKFDSVGILNLSCGQIMDVAILSYDDDGTLLDNSGYTNVCHYNDKEGRRCCLVTTGGQGICYLDLSWGEDTSVTLEELAGLYCERCMEKIRMLDEEWASGRENNRSCPFALADFATGKLYSLNGAVTVCFIRDYYVDLQCNERAIKGRIVYKLGISPGQEHL